jgi:hypothetical protein
MHVFEVESSLSRLSEHAQNLEKLKREKINSAGTISAASGAVPTADDTKDVQARLYILHSRNFPFNPLDTHED